MWKPKYIDKEEITDVRSLISYTTLKHVYYTLHMKYTAATCYKLKLAMLGPFTACQLIVYWSACSEPLFEVHWQERTTPLDVLSQGIIYNDTPPDSRSVGRSGYQKQSIYFFEMTVCTSKKNKLACFTLPTICPVCAIWMSIASTCLALSGFTRAILFTAWVGV